MPGFGTWSKPIIFMVKTFAVYRKEKSGRSKVDLLGEKFLGGLFSSLYVKPALKDDFR